MADIGSLYHAIGDLDNVEFYLKKYLELNVQDEVESNINAHATLGLAYIEKGMDSLAIHYMKKALDLSIEAKHKAWIGLSHGNLGHALFMNKRLDEALSHLLIDIKISTEIKSYESAAGSYVMVGQVYQQKKQYDKSKYYLDSALHFLDINAKATATSNVRIKAYKALADYFTQVNSYDKANFYLQQAWNLRDSINLYKNKQGIVLQIAEMNDWKEKQNAIFLHSTIDEKKKNETIFFVSIAGAALILAFVMLLLKQKQSLNKALQERNSIVHSQKEAVEAREKQLAVSNEAKTKLFSIIAHDLRAPIGNLEGLLGMMEGGAISGEALQEHLPEISSKVSTLSNTIDNLLSWTYSQMEGIEAYKEKVDLASMVNRLKHFFKPAFISKNVVIANEVKASTFVEADKNYLETILRNLLSNAIKFSDEGSTVTVSTEQQNGKLVICIADKGVGMPKEKMENLFIKNDAKISTYGTKGEKGTGLGLIICKELVAKNDGQIWAEANEPVGTIFKVSFKS